MVRPSYPYKWPGAVCAQSDRSLAVGKAVTPAGQFTGLAVPEPDTRVGISLASRLRNQDEAGAGCAGRDLLLVNNTAMF